jgi:hypothetical protein
MIAEKPTRLPRQKVLDALQGGIQTWDRLRALTKLNDERLGFALGELLDLRKIWTGHHGSVRIYGIERRTDRVPRFTPPKRRATDIM